MRSVILTIRVCVTCTLMLCTLAARAEPATVVIETSSGRLLRGEVDHRSDGHSLWVRRSEGDVILTSSVAWADIVSAEVDGEPINAEVLEADHSKYATSPPATLLTEYELKAPVSPALPWYALSRRQRVRSIEIDATLASLDRTVESDGLLVAVAVFDDQGQLVPTRGALSARLIVERLDPHTGQVSFEEFQRWSAQLSAQDFHDGIAELPLRFRRASPEHRWDLCTAALLNVRVGVPGQGNFAASVPVAIHEFNPIRDEMRNQQGARFYRDELTHSTRHDGPRQLHRGFSPPRSYGF